MGLDGEGGARWQPAGRRQLTWAVISQVVAALAAAVALVAPATDAAQGERPKLIPLVAAESGYGENSSVNILCTVSQGHHESLQFDWFKDGQPVAADWPAAPQLEQQSDHSLLRIARVQPHHAGRYTCSAKSQFGQDSSSVNLLVNVKLQWIREPPKEIVVSLNQELKLDCLAQGEPRPAMRWERLDAGAATFELRPPAPGSTSSSSAPAPLSLSAVGKRQHHHAAGQAAHVEPGKNQLASTGPTASGASRLALGQFGSHQRNQPHQPHQQLQQQAAAGRQLVSSSRHLNIAHARESDSGFYECIASNSNDNDLTKLVHVQVKGPPKILPIATADSYPEGSSINLICTVSGGQRRGLTLSWTVDGEPVDATKLKYSTEARYQNIVLDSTNAADISIVKIENATLKNSGQYTCTARNPLGEDSTSVDIVINVEMKWTKLPNDQVEVGLNQELKLECDASGSPQPTIEWFKHSSDESSKATNGTNLLAKAKVLRLARTQHRDSGLYECVARNGLGGELLRKVVHVRVRDFKLDSQRQSVNWSLWVAKFCSAECLKE